MLGLINRTIQFKNPKVLLPLYKSVVRPHLEYCSAVWSPQYVKDKALLKKVKHRFSRMFHELKLAFCVYVRPLLEFSSQVWSPHYKYLIDKVESVQRFFTKRITKFTELSYTDRLRNRLSDAV